MLLPHRNLAPAMRETCERYWCAAGGLPHRLHLQLDPVFLALNQTDALCDAVGLLLHGGLSPGFSPCQDHLGVNLWVNGRPEGVLLIADDNDRLTGEPQTADVARARSIIAQADCRLVCVPARGTVWRVHIPPRHMILARDMH